MIVSQLSHAEKQLLRATNRHFNHLIPPQNASWQLDWIEASVYNFKTYRACHSYTCLKLYPFSSYIALPPDSDYFVECGTCKGIQLWSLKVVRSCTRATKIRRACPRMRIRGEREELATLRRTQGLGRGFWEESGDDTLEEETEWCDPYSVSSHDG